jgi:hypothetical protein
MLAPDLDRALVACYRGWDRLERERFASSVIDFDLAEPADAANFVDRAAVVDELERLRGLVDSDDDPERSLVRARLRASLAYLRALENLNALPFREYVKATMGIEPAMLPDGRVRAFELRVRQSLRGYRQRAIPFSRAGFQAFRVEFQTGTGENLKRQFAFFRDKWVPHLTRAVHADFDVSSIVVEFANEDAYWKNWISGNVAEGEPITLRINVHERHIWFQGAVEILVLHEYCGHAVQMALWRESVRRKEIASFLGILTVHFPDQFLLEGLAESLAHVLPDEHHKLEKRSEIIRDLQAYNLAVLNNVHIIANEKGLDEARTYARQRLPFTPEETIERELRDRTRHPLFRTYQYVYAPAKDAFVRALTPAIGALRWQLLGQLYRRPMTPEGVMELLDV